MTNTGAKTCFVISPIGPPDSDIRAHADEVLILIEEALQECGVRPLRSDHLKEPGRISAQMYRQIFGSDMCIAVLTGGNPNVYYELGYAQAMGKKVIVTAAEDTPLPFDIFDVPTQFWDSQTTLQTRLLAQIDPRPESDAVKGNPLE